MNDTAPERHWFVAYVRSCQERKAAEALSRCGVEHYLPVQRVRRQWSDRVKVVEQLVLPRMIFIRATEAERLKLFDLVPQIVSFISNGGSHNPAVVRSSEMSSFRAMVEQSFLSIRTCDTPPAPGDRVRMIQGPLAGYEFELVSVDGTQCAAVRLGAAGTFMVSINASDFKKI